MLDIEELRNELPKIGDILIKEPVTDRSVYKTEIKYPCVVTYVNSKHLWYQVEFNIGKYKFKENYNLIDDYYSDEMNKYWTDFDNEFGSLYVESKKQGKTFVNWDKNMRLRYNGKSATPRMVKPDPSFKSVYDISKELKDYNERHKKHITYGEYVRFTERKKEN